MQHSISTTDIKAIVGYLEAYIAKMSSEPRLTTREINKVRRATLLLNKLKKNYHHERFIHSIYIILRHH